MEADIDKLFDNLMSDNLHSVTCIKDVPYFYTEIPANYGVILFITRQDGTSHACILAKNSNNEIVMIDPQLEKAVIGEDNVNTYFQNDKVERACFLTAKAETGTNQEKRRRLTGGNKKTKYNKKQNITKNKRTKHSKKRKTTHKKKYRNYKK
jgi:hypothetical protein